MDSSGQSIKVHLLFLVVSFFFYNFADANERWASDLG